jgi:hypothetical protein
MNKNYENYEDIISHLKSWDWDFIIDFGLNHVNNIRGNQYNFLRGSLIETVISQQDDKLTFVGDEQNHKDFNWDRFGVTIECKSLLNKSLYDQRGKLKDSLKFNLCGLRSNRKIKQNEICDFILVIMKDGSFIIPKSLAKHNTIQTGNKVDIVIASNHITEISGPKNLTKVIQKISINEMLKDFQNTVIKNARQNFNQK